MAQTALGLNPPGSEAVDDLVVHALADIEAAADLEALKAVKPVSLGDQAPPAPTNRKTGQLAPADRGTTGKNLGGARARLPQVPAERGQILEAEHKARALAEESVDITAFGARSVIGAYHPIGTSTEEIEDFFTSIGWEITEGSEIEHEWFSFDSLNFGIDHPAHQMQDTFHIDDTTIGGGAPEDEYLTMRTHTSPMQSRFLPTRGVPPYVACPGKIFRSNAPNATHTPVFHQVESLMIDKGLIMAYFKGALDHFARTTFGPDMRVRPRPSFFSFIEPSTEPDTRFLQREGEAGWVEVGGCGTVNSSVLYTNGIGPDEYTGFAFGTGIERTLMLRHGIAGMHDIVEGDVRSSQQFGLRGRGH